MFTLEQQKIINYVSNVNEGKSYIKKPDALKNISKKSVENFVNNENNYMPDELEFLSRKTWSRVLEKETSTAFNSAKTVTIISGVGLLGLVAINPALIPVIAKYSVLGMRALGIGMTVNGIYSLLKRR